VAGRLEAAFETRLLLRDLKKGRGLILTTWKGGVMFCISVWIGRSPIHEYS